jgi:cyclohexa-1,5-dienecarbonyl-CoA hydratase
MPVSVSFNADRSRAAFRIAHVITLDVLDALRAGLEGLGQNPHLKLVTFEGEGADFSFGASIPEHMPEHIGRVLPAMHGLVEDLLDAPAVTAAIVRGRCLGGGFELALACDLIFAAEDAMFGLPEIRLGVFAPAASVLLPARIGSARATTEVITGQLRPAQDWLNAGLVELIAPSADLPVRVDEWFAAHLAPKSAAALRHAAAAVRTGVRENVRATLPVVERLYLEGVMGTHDAKEGLDAFMQKRAPRWLDR